MIPSSAPAWNPKLLRVSVRKAPQHLCVTPQGTALGNVPAPFLAMSPVVWGSLGTWTGVELSNFGLERALRSLPSQTTPQFHDLPSQNPKICSVCAQDHPLSWPWDVKGCEEPLWQLPPRGGDREQLIPTLPVEIQDFQGAAAPSDTRFYPNTPGILNFSLGEGASRKTPRELQKAAWPCRGIPVRDFSLGFKRFLSCCEQTEMCHPGH